MSCGLCLSDSKAVSLVLVTAFFFYFTSEMLLRQYALAGMGSKDLNVNKIITRLPEGIREKVMARITKGRLLDQLAAAKTDGEYISTRIALASMETEDVLEKTYLEISERFPNNPESMSSFLFFFRGGPRMRQVSVADYHLFIGRLPEADRYFAWEAGLSKIKGTGGDNLDRIEFLRPLLEIEPKYKDYLRLYVELTEAAFQEGATAIENRSRELEEACEKLPTLMQVMERSDKEKSGKQNKGSK
ncbi:MAG: hypothetical protein JW808_04530 [Victivallales bacterium]|nr:hypothetical protein [Victivallales bacterium]